MAASQRMLFWFLVLCPRGQLDPSTGQRFSKHKLCIDNQCSMLMYVGVALEDFAGPDCRFVNFKKGDHVYVNYKLVEASPELWAGSVGHSFGYFPRDLIKSTHGYGNVKDLQVPADVGHSFGYFSRDLIKSTHGYANVKELQVPADVGHSFGYFPRDLINSTHGYANVKELQVPADLFATLASGVSSKLFEVLTICFGVVLVIILLRKTTLVKERVYQDQMNKLNRHRTSLQSAIAVLEEECETLRQKAETLDEMYKEKEMILLKKLSREEYERQEKEQRLSATDEKVVLAAEEVKTYKQRIKEMEEKLQKTERSFKNQIATHEKKTHDTWLKGRAVERALAEEKMETANLRQKLVEMTRKMAMGQDEPGTVKPMPGRPNTQTPPQRGPPSQNGSFGPSPVSGGECSRPLTAEPTGRPLSATFNPRGMPRGEFDPGCGPASMNSSSRSSSPAKVMDDGKQTIPQEPEAPSVPTVTSLAEHPVAVNMDKGPPPPFPGVPPMGSPVGRPPPPPIPCGPRFQLDGPFGPRPFPPPPPIGYGPPFQHDGPFGPRPFPPPPIGYGPPFQLGGPFGPRPFRPPFGPGMRPPLGLREYAPGVPTGKRDLPFDPREFVPGPPPFRPLGPFGPREHFIPGTQLPPPSHGPQDCGPPPAARDIMPSGLRDEPPPATQSSEDCPQPLKQGP